MAIHSIKHLFFDLDRTLWDFEANSDETLRELHAEYNLVSLGAPDAAEFIVRYKAINEECWADYRTGALDKETLRTIRFERTLREYGINDKALSIRFGEAYVDQCPYKTKVFPGTHEMLKALSGRFQLHIITNGFQEIQPIKMSETGLTPYFDQIITSEKAGVKKPNAEIFHYAMRLASARPEESMMIGDDLPVDVRGALAVGMEAVWFAPGEPKNTEGISQIFELMELVGLLEGREQG